MLDRLSNRCRSDVAGSLTERWLVSLPPLLIVILAAALSACQSSSTNVTGPSGTKCAITLPSTLPTMGANGGTGTLTITVAPECVWSASSAAEWISITSNASGQGTGSVAFAASGNPTALVRRGALMVGERRVEIAQSGAACQFTLAPQTASVAAAGGEGSMTLNAIEGCQWSATSQAEWISIVGAASGSGSGLVRFAAGANDGPARSGLIAIADRTFAVNQSASGSACAIALEDAERLVPAIGGTDSVGVTAAGDCPWTAVSRSGWITVTNGAAGRGPGRVTLTIAPNSGGTRVGFVGIGGHTYVITQAAATSGSCSYSLGASDVSAAAAGGETTVGVTAPAGCAWTTSSSVPWIVVAGGAVGNGSGAATLAIAANTGPARSGTVLVAGQVVTVSQAAAAAPPPQCTYDLGSDEQSVPSSGGPASVTVSAGAGCSWTATSQAPWITIANGASGSGNGTVALAIAANGGAQRSGSVAIAGRTHTITQASGLLPCSYAVDATEFTAGTDGGTVQIGVTAGLTCTWQARSNAPWISVSSGANGLGNGTVRLTIAANDGAQRTGTATIAGHTFTVTQAPARAACTYSLNPTAQAVSLLGGDFTVAVTTQPGCTWSATTGDNWITFPGNTTGSGNGSVAYRVPLVSLGLLFSRTGHISIAGQTLTVNQSGLLANAR